MPWLRAASDSSSMVMPLAGSVMAPLLWLWVLQVEAAQKLGVEGDDDGGQAHQDGTDGRGQDDPADSMATSMPAPMAMPTSAPASAGASLTPSPTMATDRPRPCRSATRCALCSGRT